MSAVEGEITQGFSTMNCKQDLYERPISADLEILSWYRSLVDRLNVAEALAEPPAAIAAALLAGMRGAVAADSVAIVPCSSTDECFDRSSLQLNAKLDIDGERLFADAAYFDLVESFQHDVIKSDVAAGPHGNQFANVRNVVVVQINKYGYSLGYLLAVNSRNGDGFGTQEVTLLRTAATVLAYYGHTYELAGVADQSWGDGPAAQLPQFGSEAAG